MRGYALMRARRIRRLGAMPVLCEAAVDSAVFIGVYGMPPALGFTGGFILSALSPTVLVTGAPRHPPSLRARGAGVRRVPQCPVGCRGTWQLRSSGMRPACGSRARLWGRVTRP